MKNNLPAAAALIAALAAPQAFADITYLDNTMTTGDWQTIILEQTPRASFTVNGVASQGNLFTVVNVGFAQTQGQTTETINIARIRPTFTWNPAVDGPLESMDFSFRAQHNGSFGYNSQVVLFWRPVIVQNGLTYSVLSSSLQPPINGQLNPLSWNFTNNSNWANFQNQNLTPDFSATGAPIQFGYRVQQSAVCSAPANQNCTNSGIVGLIDDYRVELRGSPVSSVPEPGTWGMLAAAALFAMARRARNSRSV